MSTPSRKLPDRPDLDQLKKQAKELLKAIQAGDPDALREVAACTRDGAPLNTPPFQVEDSTRRGGAGGGSNPPSTHPEPLHWDNERPTLSPIRQAQGKQPLPEREGSKAVPSARSFQLSDAQLILARSYGFDSWPRLKAFVDGVTMQRFIAAVKAGDLPAVRNMLKQRPELAHMDSAGNDEHTGLHHAVLQRDPAMTRLLLEAGADPRKGIYPHRDATTAYQLAKDRGYDDIVAIIDEEELARRQAASCPNVTLSPKQDDIARAIAAGRNDEAIALMDADMTLLRACDRLGKTPLHVAAGAMNVEMVRWLVDRRADAAKMDLSGKTPLETAVTSVTSRTREKKQRFAEVADLLIRRGCEVTPLAAVALGDVKRLRGWHEREPARLRESDRMLETAVIFGQYAALRFLLDAGLDPDEPRRVAGLDEIAWSRGGPLWHAALFGEHAMAELLIARGADVNANVYASGWPIMHAYNNRDQRMKDLLLRHGARVDPYVIATNHDLPAARALIAAGDHPCEDNTSYGCRTVLETLLWGACNGPDAQIAALCMPHIRRAPDDVWWNGMFEQPMRIGDKPPGEAPACLRLLLSTGADPNLTRRFGQRAIHFLCSRVGHPDAQRAFAAILLDAGARLDLRDDLLQSTPLGWACRWGRTELVRLFIEHGAIANEPDAEPWATPLAWAQKMNHGEIVALLRNHGAST